MWENDPQVCRDADPEWFAKIELQTFGYNMRQGHTPEQAYRDIEKRKRYIAFLKEHKSPLAEG
jgi:hypothetical protein